MEERLTVQDGPREGVRDERKIVCIGFMGAGKTTAAHSAAVALGLAAIDVDQAIEQRLGKSIERVFAEEGEGTFRDVEEQVTLELLERHDHQVLALGGGAITSEAVRRALSAHLVVWIDVDSDTAWARCGDGGRPLASERGEFERLYRDRQPLYEALADVVVPAERSHAMPQVLDALEGLPADAKLLWADTGSGDYAVYVGSGLLTEHRFWPGAIAGRRFLVTDGNVGPRYRKLVSPLAGEVMIVPGEQSKTVAHAKIVWSELARHGMTRSDLVIALGGGVVGDLAGFCAATYQRGVRYVQVPTTLVAQVDSAYGGKTGVDLAEAKNYVGSYHQPVAVITDPDTLATLPTEELAAGYAEVVKTGLIAGGSLWERIAGGADPASVSIIAACALVKLRIVAKDERDAGLRQVLNLGHTVGHAIEAATGYASYRHGQAVALGLLAALRLSGQDELRRRVRQMLGAHGLETSLRGVDPQSVVAATARDKKRSGDRPVPFVLLEAPGQPRTGCTVSGDELLAAVKELCETA